MKKLVILLLSLGMLSACNKSSDNDIVTVAYLANKYHTQAIYLDKLTSQDSLPPIGGMRGWRCPTSEYLYVLNGNQVGWICVREGHVVEELQ